MQTNCNTSPETLHQRIALFWLALPEMAFPDLLVRFSFVCAPGERDFVLSLPTSADYRKFEKRVLNNVLLIPAQLASCHSVVAIFDHYPLQEVL